MKFISFMASQHGRLLRGSVGLVLTIAAILWLHGSGQVVALAIGGVLLGVAIFDLCLLAPLFGKPLSGGSICKRPSHTAMSVLLSVAALLAVTGAVLARPTDTITQATNTTTVDQKTAVATPPSETSAEAVASNKQTQEAQLLYLIEEEKLAHDVYTVHA
jgi:hypothetical protein